MRPYVHLVDVVTVVSINEAHDIRDGPMPEIIYTMKLSTDPTCVPKEEKVPKFQQNPPRAVISRVAYYCIHTHHYVQ